MILLLLSKSKFFIFDHADSENLRYLAETKKQCTEFLYVAKYVKMYQKIIKNCENVEGKLVTFALDPKLD